MLLYHRVDREADPALRPFCVDPDTFAGQMAWLAGEGYKTITLPQLQQYYQHGLQVPEQPIVITFDDGYYCNYTRAFPAMRAHGFAGTIFLATDLMREPTPVVESKDSFLSWDEIREMQASGFSFQAHGCSHRPLTEISPDEVAREACESKTVIEAQLQNPVHYFCYPYSRYNEQIKRNVAQAGYAGACGGPPFWEGGPTDWFEIGRTEILWSDSFKQFRFKIKYGLGYYYFARRQLGKIKKKIAL